MAKILDQLERDHENVARMLDLLETQLDRVQEMKSTDFELMRDVMHYMTQYPDKVHHPMEDAMIRRMVERDASTREATDVILREHGGLAEKGSAFFDVLSQVVDGGMVERTELEARGRDYVAFLRSHMQKEDEGIFPLAARTLTDEDWAAVEEEIDARADPVFGPIVEEHFASLLRFIREQAD